jgi:hypothetical protein
VSRTKNEASVWLRFLLIGVQDSAERLIDLFKTILAFPVNEYLNVVIIIQLSIKLPLLASGGGQKLADAQTGLKSETGSSTKALIQ